MVRSPWWWCIYVGYMVIFIRIRRSTKLEYTTSLLDDESLICCCRHMHKDHIIQLWCRIPIVLGSHMDEDCYYWWYQEILTKYLELKVCWIHSAMLDTWMITQSCIVGDMMMISSYLYDDIIHSWKFMIMFKINRMSWYLYASIPCHRLMISTVMDIYRSLVWMLLTDAYGGDHTLCMIVADDYHSLVLDILSQCHVYHSM